MRLDPRTLFAPLVALLALVVVLQLTSAALSTSGAWRRDAGGARATRVDPYAPLDRALALRAAPPPDGPLRDPFAFGGAPVASVAGGARPRPRATRDAPPAAPPRPVLTAIVWDSDPRATVRWNGRDYSVRPNTLFAEFRVVSIGRGQVVLDRNGESLVLTLPARQP
uniref:Uncharacterized protein n=1 Tax=Eiseniibacteriota bacterium TaxID=2212470 RepID=A0A832ML98_UNCEI